MFLSSSYITYQKQITYKYEFHEIHLYLPKTYPNSRQNRENPKIP